MSVRTWWRAVALAGAVAVVAGCNGPGADQARQVSQSFEQLATTDAEQACTLLSGHTRDQFEKQAKKGCADAMGDEDLPDPSDLQFVEVYGHDALARFANDTVFLALFPEGWKITAASCRAGTTSEDPYDCDISGG